MPSGCGSRGRVRRGLVPFSESAIDSLVGYLLVGMLLGARIFYALVYDRARFAADPVEIVRVWHGGLSFHGAVLGMVTACALFARRNRIPFAPVADTLALAGAPGLFFGRIGNFINAELFGRATTVPWAMVFPTDPTRLPRHPSQLYEAVCEGIVLFLILRTIERRAVRGGWYRPGLLAGVFLIGYGVLRFLVEFTREPDAQLGFVLATLSMGQLLSAAMVAIGVAVLLRLYAAVTASAPSDT